MIGLIFLAGYASHHIMNSLHRLQCNKTYIRNKNHVNKKAARS